MFRQEKTRRSSCSLDSSDGVVETVDRKDQKVSVLAGFSPVGIQVSIRVKKGCCGVRSGGEGPFRYLRSRPGHGWAVTPGGSLPPPRSIRHSSHDASVAHPFMLSSSPWSLQQAWKGLSAGWPRLPPDLTARHDEGLPLLSAPGTFTSSAPGPPIGRG